MFLGVVVVTRGFLRVSDGKESACNEETAMGLISQLGRFPGEGNGHPLQLFLPVKFCG